MSFAGMRQHFRQLRSTLRTRSIGHPFQNLSDACTRLPRTPVRASVDARSCICRTPVPVCVWALGGNFIMTRTVPHALLATQVPHLYIVEKQVKC